MTKLLMFATHHLGHLKPPLDPFKSAYVPY
jgi:hypothetical protein